MPSNNFFNNIVRHHRDFWSREHALLLWGGMCWFLFALLLQHFAYNYIDNFILSVPVPDLLLNNLPTVNLDIIVVQAPLLITALVLILYAIKPRYLPFSLKTLALFIIIRSFFISLTHLGADLHQISLNVNTIGFSIYDFLYNAKNDFFFSGHVGMTFLFSLIFWQEKFWRYFFLAVSFIFGASMILAHMHYSIDVFAAPFITYSIFVMAKKIFVADFNLTGAN